MGVYIDMEMPKSCEKCPFFDYEEGFCFASWAKGKNGWDEFTLCPGGIKDGRADGCPLVPVPEHGRLIDADVLAAQCDDPYWCVWLSDIEDAPTIIPAEEILEQKSNDKHEDLIEDYGFTAEDLAKVTVVQTDDPDLDGKVAYTFHGIDIPYAYIEHTGIKGQKWGIRRFQNYDDIH